MYSAAYPAACSKALCVLPVAERHSCYWMSMSAVTGPAPRAAVAAGVCSAVRGASGGAAAAAGQLAAAGCLRGRGHARGRFLVLAAAGSV